MQRLQGFQVVHDEGRNEWRVDVATSPGGGGPASSGGSRSEAPVGAVTKVDLGRGGERRGPAADRAPSEALSAAVAEVLSMARKAGGSCQVVHHLGDGRRITQVFDEASYHRLTGGLVA